MLKVVLLLAILAFFFPKKGDATETVRIPSFTTEHPIIKYLEHQLELAMAITDNDFGKAELVRLKLPVAEERQLRNLNQGITDIAWASCTLQRNTKYQMVPVPMLAGLFSSRVNIVRANDKRFENIDSLEQLKSMIAVQSSKWPDYNVLVNNGLTVLSSDRFSAYRALEKGLADYYPRGVSEALGELEAANAKNLIVAPGHLLQYPVFFIIYVSKDNKQLAERLATGFQRTIANGQFLTLLETQDWYITAKALMKNRKSFKLVNNASSGACLQIEQTHEALLNAPFSN